MPPATDFGTASLQKVAEEKGHQQVLWLYGDDHQITEVGTMNIFVFMLNKNGGKLIRFLVMAALINYLNDYCCSRKCESILLR